MHFSVQEHHNFFITMHTQFVVPNLYVIMSERHISTCGQNVRFMSVINLNFTLETTIQRT